MTEPRTFRAVFWAGMALLAIAGGVAALYALRDLLTPVIAGLLVAYLLYPGVVRLARIGVARWLSVTLMILLVLAVGFIAWLGWAGGRTAAALATALPGGAVAAWRWWLS